MRAVRLIILCKDNCDAERLMCKVVEVICPCCTLCILLTSTLPSPMTSMPLTLSPHSFQAWTWCRCGYAQECTGVPLRVMRLSTNPKCDSTHRCRSTIGNKIITVHKVFGGNCFWITVTASAAPRINECYSHSSRWNLQRTRTDCHYSSTPEASLGQYRYRSRPF